MLAVQKRLTVKDLGCLTVSTDIFDFLSGEERIIDKFICFALANIFFLLFLSLINAKVIHEVGGF